VEAGAALAACGCAQAAHRTPRTTARPWQSVSEREHSSQKADEVGSTAKLAKLAAVHGILTSAVRPSSFLPASLADAAPDGLPRRLKGRKFKMTNKEDAGGPDDGVR